MCLFSLSLYLFRCMQALYLRLLVPLSFLRFFLALACWQFHFLRCLFVETVTYYKNVLLRTHNFDLSVGWLICSKQFLLNQLIRFLIFQEGGSTYIYTFIMLIMINPKNPPIYLLFSVPLLPLLCCYCTLVHIHTSAIT